MKRNKIPGEEFCSEAALRSNWIDIARLALALLVIFSHSYPLCQGSNDREPLFVFTHEQKTFGTVAVDLFFIISGFLIVRSWLYSRSMQDYFHRRILRIYPGFALAILVSIGLAMISCASPLQYLTELPKAWLALTFMNLSYGVLDVPTNAFLGNSIKGVNGSLWTIPLEFMAYVGVAVYGLFGLYQFRYLWLVIYALILAHCSGRVFAHAETAEVWELVSCFASGAAFYLFHDLIPRSAILFFFSVVLLVATMFVPPWFNVLFPVAAGYAFFYAALLPGGPWTKWAKTMDLSYGTYLYAFVIQQSLVYWLHLKFPPLLFLAAVPLSLLCAAGSWFLIEKPFLNLKRHKFLDYDPSMHRAVKTSA